MLFFTMQLNLIIDELIIVYFFPSINHFMTGFKLLDRDQIFWLFGWWQKSSHHFLMVKSWPSKWQSKSSWHFLRIKIFFQIFFPFWMKFSCWTMIGCGLVWWKSWPLRWQSKSGQHFWMIKIFFSFSSISGLDLGH